MLDQNLPITNCKTFTEPNSLRAERNQWRSPHWSDTQHFNSKWNLFWELLILVAAQFSMIYYLPDWYWLEELRPSQSSPVVSPHHDFLRPKLCYINGAKAPLNNKPSGGICQRWWSDNKITSLSVWRTRVRPDPRNPCTKLSERFLSMISSSAVRIDLSIEKNSILFYRAVHSSQFYTVNLTRQKMRKVMEVFNLRSAIEPSL